MKKAILFLNVFVVLFVSLMASSSVFAATSSKSTESITSVVSPNSVAIGSRPGVTVTAEIDDKIGVIKIVLFYRLTGASDYNSETMHADEKGDYRYVINQTEAESASAGLEYYIEVSDFTGNRLLHGSANLPLLASFGDGSGNAVAVKNVGAEFGVKNFKNQDGYDPDNANEPLWKNKWLWIGVGVLAAAAIADSNSGGDEPAGEPGFSIDIEGSSPEPAGP